MDDGSSDDFHDDDDDDCDEDDEDDGDNECSDFEVEGVRVSFPIIRLRGSYPLCHDDEDSKVSNVLGLEYSNDHEQSDSIDDTVKSMILLLIILVNDDAQVVTLGPLKLFQTNLWSC